MYKKLLKNAWEVSEVMWILSNENRLLVLCFIWNKDRSVTDISKELQISQSLVSQILSRLKAEGLVDSKRVWKEVFYEIKDKKICKVINALKWIYC